ncbi:MAG: carboxypeptidase-like regulatory domain-containing protein, partial [Saprospiraceae bacterium]|nr:carboxypeptidase-like regulatory domain-containing protein [Saprospiraceae bacterium]
MIKRIGLSLFGLFFALVLGAQTGSIRGNVYEKETGDPVMFATVRLLGTDIGNTTDLDGFFNISNIPVGDYRLVVSYVGFDSIGIDISIAANKIENEQLFMVSSGVELATVNVSARKEQAQSEVQISQVTLTPKQITSLPSTGGEPDIAQYLPVLPGIVSTGDQGGQLYIRGGSPIQNLVMLDGMTIFNPFHSIGFFSVFETETIRSVDVMTGGFNAEYGGRISAVVDIKTREGNKKRFGGLVSASPFMGKVLLEGPLKKLQDTGGGSISYLLTAKHSYINETSPFLYSYAVSAVDTAASSLPFTFTDLYGKLSFVSGNGSKMNIFGFNFNDRVNYSVADLNWKSRGGGTNFTLVPPASNFILGGTLAFSDYNIELVEGDNYPRTSSISSYSAQLDFTYFGNNNEVKYGFIFNGLSTDFEFRNFLGVTIEQFDFTTELAGFIKLKQIIGNLIIEPSLRAQSYPSQGKSFLEPRLGAKFKATERIRLKLASGLYS